MAATAFVLAAAAIGTVFSNTIPTSLIASAAAGFGVGGLHLLIRLAWADYYGREHLGTIRGLTMSAQVGGQALGPIIGGFMFDSFGDYQWPFIVFAVSVFLGGLLVLSATPPKLPPALAEAAPTATDG